MISNLNTLKIKTRHKRAYKHTNVSVADKKLRYTLDQLRAKHPIMALARMLNAGADTLDKIRDEQPVRNTALARIAAKVNELMNPVDVDRVLTVLTLANIVETWDPAYPRLAQVFIAAGLDALVSEGKLPPDVVEDARRALDEVKRRTS